nr:diguanylate cyclase [Atribacterota bacterium]
KKFDDIDFYPPGKKEEGEELTKKTFYSTFVRFETIRKAKDGRSIPVKISSSQMKIKDQTSGVIGLYEDITEQKQNEELQQVLYNISEAASSPMSLAQLYRSIHTGLKKVINANNFYIALLNEEKDKISFVYYSDELDENSTPIDVSLKNTLTGYLIKGQQSLLLNYSQMQELVLERKIDIYGPLSKNICWLGVPLKMEGKVFGVIVVQDYNNPVSYSSKDIKLMEIVAVQAATAITRKQSEEKIIYISFHDTLTGLYNRAYFEEELKRVNHPRFYPLSMVMVDVNGLKAVNDAFGHHQGDQLLKNLANILKRNSREVDVLARLGGDEFAIVLPNTSSAAAETYCQRIINDCQQNNFEPLYLNPNISMGFATQEGNFSDYEAIFREADKKMYQNKLLNVKSKEKFLLDAFLSILLERDIHTEKHAQRLVNIASMMGKKIGLSPYDLDKLRLLALLHDIGKIGVPEKILFKVAPLTDEEWRVLKNHTNIGYRIAKNIPDFSSIANEILYHHERWDGNGYPSGLKGKDIPLLSRIISIVDAFDTMQATRPYKKPLTREQALAEIRRNAGTQFDPELVKVFFEVIEQKLLK